MKSDAPASPQTVRPGPLFACENCASDFPIALFDPSSRQIETFSVDKAAIRLGICVGSVD